MPSCTFLRRTCARDQIMCDTDVQLLWLTWQGECLLNFDSDRSQVCLLSLKVLELCEGEKKCFFLWLYHLPFKRINIANVRRFTLQRFETTPLVSSQKIPNIRFKIGISAYWRLSNLTSHGIISCWGSHHPVNPTLSWPLTFYELCHGNDEFVAETALISALAHDGVPILYRRIMKLLIDSPRQSPIANASDGGTLKV